MERATGADCRLSLHEQLSALRTILLVPQVGKDTTTVAAKPHSLQQDPCQLN